MASKKRGRRKRRARGGIGQRIAVALATVVLVLCAASITFGLFVRQVGPDGRARALRVSVENGTGASGIASAAQSGLEKLGVDVLSVGNAGRFDYAESMLVARKRGADVERLGQQIGCKRVLAQFDKDAAEDATLILGADYQHLHLEWSEEKGLAD
jgi:LytR cell envelope-related transcriptional attenuator